MHKNEILELSLAFALNVINFSEKLDLRKNMLFQINY